MCGTDGSAHFPHVADRKSRVGRITDYGGAAPASESPLLIRVNLRPCFLLLIRGVFEFLAQLTRTMEKRSLKPKTRVRRPIFDKDGYQINLPKSLAASMRAAVPVDPKDIEWLPSPEEFAEMRKTTKVTLHLSKRSLKLLKEQSTEVPDALPDTHSKRRRQIRRRNGKVGLRLSGHEVIRVPPWASSLF